MTVSPFSIELRTERTLVIFANMPFIKEVKRSVLGALDGEHLNFAFYTDAAAQKALAYMDQGREFVESLRTGEYRHKSLDVQLYLKAPIIVVPENV